MPVATVGVDRGDNAGALAIQILACSDSKLAEAYSNFRTEMTEKVISDDNSIQGETRCRHRCWSMRPSGS